MAGMRMLPRLEPPVPPGSTTGRNSEACIRKNRLGTGASVAQFTGKKWGGVGVEGGRRVPDQPMAWSASAEHHRYALASTVFVRGGTCCCDFAAGCALPPP